MFLVRDTLWNGFAGDGLVEEFPHLLVSGCDRNGNGGQHRDNALLVPQLDLPLLGTFPIHMTHSLRLAGAAG